VKSRIRRFMHPPRRAIPTRAGLFALGAPIVLGVAAVNASNNLLFMLLGGVLGAIVLSGILSERNMHGVVASVRPLSNAYANEPTRLLVTLEREDGSTPFYALMLKERRGDTFFLDLIARRSRAELLSVTMPIVAGKTERRLGTRVFEARGEGKLGRCELLTRYPFGLLTKSRDVDVDVVVLVRPKRVEVPEALADPGRVAIDGDAAERRGVGLEVYGLREKEDRDAFQRIHALRSLTLGTDVVIETDAVERPMAWLGVENRSGADPIAFERALEVAQAVLVEWDRRGFAVGLATCSGMYPPNTASLDTILDVLAKLELVDGDIERRIEPPIWIVPSGASNGSPDTITASIDDQGRLSIIPRSIAKTGRVA
jgi:uncharacterized protein (DUF58 family)